MGSKAAEGAKSVGASAVVSFCSFDPLLTRPPWPSKEPLFSAEYVHLILTSFPPAQAIGSKGIATAGSKLKQPSPSRELLSSPHLCAFFLPPLHKCNTLRMYTPRFKYTPCVKTGPFYTMCVHSSSSASRVACDAMPRSGMIGLDPATRALVTGGPYAEAKQVMKALPENFSFQNSESFAAIGARCVVGRQVFADFVVAVRCSS